MSEEGSGGTKKNVRDEFDEATETEERREAGGSGGVKDNVQDEMGEAAGRRESEGGAGEQSGGPGGVKGNVQDEEGEAAGSRRGIAARARGPAARRGTSGTTSGGRVAKEAS